LPQNFNSIELYLGAYLGSLRACLGTPSTGTTVAGCFVTLCSTSRRQSQVVLWQER
jgi:hypothetical protein